MRVHFSFSKFATCLLNNSLVLFFVYRLVIQAGCRASLSNTACERHEGSGARRSPFHPHRAEPNCFSRLSMYRFHSGCDDGETVRSGRLKPCTSLLEAADRLILGVGVLIAALFMATSPVTESLR